MAEYLNVLGEKNHFETDQFNNTQHSFQEKYLSLLKQFNDYKQSAIKQYEHFQAQIQKNNLTQNNLLRKLQKKYQILLHQQRTKLSKMKQKLENNFEKQRQTFRQIISNKNKAIEQLTEMIKSSQKQKTEIIEQNTNNLINIVKSEQNCMQSRKYSHTELMKMYQYVLEENNCLKKQLIKLSSLNEQKSNQKTKRNKNTIVYTENSDLMSKYNQSLLNASGINHNKSNILINQQSSFANNPSTHSQPDPLKPSSIYKPKISHVSKRSKNTSSYHQGNDSLVELQKQKAYKKKQNKTTITNQNTKKLK